MEQAALLNNNFLMVYVLLIEDDADLRLEMKMGLEKAGHTVSESAGGHEGLSLFAQQPADVVISDVVMDDGEGIETMRRLHRLESGLPVIAISGNPTYLKSMETLGAAFGLLKPFSIKELVEAVSQFD